MRHSSIAHTIFGASSTQLTRTDEPGPGADFPVNQPVFVSPPLLFPLTFKVVFCLLFVGCEYVLIQPASDDRTEHRGDRTDGGSLDFGLPSPTGRRMKPRLSGDGRPSASSFLGPVLILSVLSVLVSSYGTCRHRAPSPSEVSLDWLQHCGSGAATS